MAANVAYFGIRHHGPGSAKRLVEALDALSPAEVLIEGPADLSGLLPTLAHAAMVPPVALLAYPKDDPAQAIFWPFAVFSPEYQATLWAVRHKVPVRFIDLPVAWRMKEPDKDVADDAELSGRADTNEPQGPLDAEQPADDVQLSPFDPSQVERDPIGALAHAAGYDDGESWWQHVIEENPEPGPIFAAVADAMAALRGERVPHEPHEAAREAHMRLEIAKTKKTADGPVAVVCGAWHVPALQAKHAAKDDRALLKGAPKRKISATFAPWTAPRLAYASGYGAGVTAPGWNRHIWETQRDDQTTRWLSRVARALRSDGHIVSTASLIEAERLAVSLAALRGRPAPGFEELREAAIACICFGNPVQWHSIATELLIGSDVGEIPDDVPLAPLLEDLQRQQKKGRLKPEALDRELSLDLRTESGLFRSTLLHRLTALNVPWGRLQDPGKSRGTFREKWILRWEPDYAVALVENLVFGPTIAQAATGRIEAQLRDATALTELSELVFSALTAQLPHAAGIGIRYLAKRAAETSDCQEMLSSLAPLADALRYGKARAVDVDQMEDLFVRIALQGALALDHAARNLDKDASQTLRHTLQNADRAVRLLQFDDVAAVWTQALQDVASDGAAAPLVAGQAARLLYEADLMSSDDAVLLMQRALSPGTPTADAAGFFEGFLDGAGTLLIHDTALRNCVGAWLADLDDAVFTEALPLFRRVFSSLDRMERKRLLDAALGRDAGRTGMIAAMGAETHWPIHLAAVTGILNGGPNGHG